MGTTLSRNDRKSIISKLVKYYEKIRNKDIEQDILCEMLDNKIIEFLKKPDVDIDFEYSNIDGYLQTDKYVLLGWNNEKEDINLDDLEEVLKK